MREMALDTLQEVTYVCPIYSVGSNLTVMTFSQGERTQHHGSCRRKRRLHDHLCRAARTSSTRPPSVPSAEQHAKNLNHLDTARISLPKALNDADSSVTSKRAELSRLKEELRALEENNTVAGYELDGTA